MNRPDPYTRLPIWLVTGFLGAGKTTFLRKIVSANQDRRLVYLVNEFSPQDIDGLDITHEGADVISIPGGSIFCRCLVTEFIGRLKAIPRQYPGIQGVVVEASGMADPKVVTKMLAETRLDTLYEVRQIITIIEPGSFLKLVYTLPNILTQTEAADVILVNKIDLYPESTIQEAEDRARAVSQDAWLMRTTYAETEIDILTLPAVERISEGEYAQCRDPNFQTTTVRFFREVDLDVVRQGILRHRADIFRAKGFVPAAGRLFRLDYSSSDLKVSEVPREDQPLALVLILRGTVSQSVIAFVQSLSA